MAPDPGQFADALRDARAGAPGGYERLWHWYSAPVAGFFRLQGAAEPGALTNEVFLGAFNGLGRFSGGEPQFRSWLFTIAHRRMVDERRRRSRRVTEVAYDPARHEAAGTSAEDEALLRSSASRVDELCRSLSPEQREVLLLRVVGDLTVEEAAKVVGRSPGAVKALQRRGLEALRRQDPGALVPHDGTFDDDPGRGGASDA